MKRTVLYLLGGLTLMFAASSCSSDEPAVDPASQSTDITAGTSRITIAAKLPEGIRSRAGADASPANPLLQATDMKNFYLGIWEMNDDGKIGQMLCDPIELHGDDLTAAITDGKFVFDFELPRRKQIRIISWTDNSDSQLAYIGVNEATLFISPSPNGSYNSFAFARDYTMSGLNDASIELSLTRPYAEIAVVSNQTETDEFKSVWKDELCIKMGMVVEQTDVHTICAWPSFYGFGDFGDTKILSGEISWGNNGTNGGVEERFADTDYPELIEGYKTLSMQYILCGEPTLGVDPLTGTIQFKFSRGLSYGADIYTTKTFENIQFKPNTRYIFVDNKENGGISNSKFNLTLKVDSNFDNGPTVTL